MSDDEESEESNDNVYDLLALSDEEPNDENDLSEEDAPLKEEQDIKTIEEGSGSNYDDIEIDIETTAIAVHKILALDEDEPDKPGSENTYLKIKRVNSNSGAMYGLEPCTQYALEVTTVFSNNATADSEPKKFKTQCELDTPCDEEEWQETFHIIQKATDYRRFLANKCNLERMSRR